MTAAPIALFVYSRVHHTRATVEALQHNDLASKSDLIIFSDGAKHVAAEAAVAQVRQYLRTIAGFRRVSIVERPANLGLAKSIISGVTEIVNDYGRVIVVEDDLVSSPYFLRYMNDALDCYAEDERVASIHAYCYPVSEALPETFFLRGADCWGWATWARAWALFEPDGRKLLSQLQKRGLARRFDFNDTYPYTRMLENQIAGRNDSWAVRWYASALLQGKLTLYPGRSLVTNIGNEGTGAHGSCDQSFDVLVASRPVRVGGIEVAEDERTYEIFVRFFVSQQRITVRRSAAKLAGLFRKYLSLART